MFKYINFNFKFSKRLYVIFFQITLLVIYFLVDKYIKLDTLDKNKNENNFINVFSYSFNQNFFAFSLIIFLIQHNNLKEVNNNEINKKIKTVNYKKNGVLYIKDIVKDKNEKKKIPYKKNKIIICILIICVLEWVIRILESLYLKDNQSYYFESLTLLMILLLSIFLKLQIYNHHLLVIIVSLLLTIFEFSVQNLDIKEIFSSIAFHLFLGCILLIDNFIMQQLLVPPLILFGLLGLGHIIINFLTLIIVFAFFDNEFESIKNYFKNNNYKIFIQVLFVFLMRLNDIFIIYFFNPIYEVFPYFVMQIVVLFSKTDKSAKNIIINTLFAIFTMFNLLVALEIIILKVFGLEKNTKIEISKRVDSDNIEEEKFTPI